MRAIQINHVTKKYKDVVALDDISFSFEYGKIYGFLGRNGAGKSTLINIIANRIFSDQGEVLVDGITAKENMEVREKIFCMSEADLYNTSLKIKDQFYWIDRFYDCFDIDKAFQIAERFELPLDKRFKALSKGYQSIFKLTAALSIQTPYVIFDEPVLGLDANHRELFYELLLNDFEQNERTIILATHLIEEVANMIEEVILIDKGHMLMQESVENLLEMGYCISGRADEVDAYCVGKNVIGFDTLGGLKLAYIMGEREQPSEESHLQISAMNLQKLFIKLTERGEN